MILIKPLMICFGASFLVACQTIPVPNIQACKTNPRTGDKRCAYYVQGESYDVSSYDWYELQDADGFTREDKSWDVSDEDILEIRKFIEAACLKLEGFCKWPEVKESLDRMEEEMSH